MFKLPNTFPTLRDNPQEWADYAEYLALKNGRISLYDLGRQQSLSSDEVQVLGVEDNDDKFNALAEEIVSEIAYRKKATSCRYPFSLTDNGYVIELSEPQDHYAVTYLYLLVCTRNKMTKHRPAGQADGALLFETLCGAVAQNFFGSRSSYEIFGTAGTFENGFREQLSAIILPMGEGRSVKPNPAYRPQDDKVDIIVWRDFADKKPSKLIAFGQCKTGTNWQDTLSQLQSEAFCKRWFTSQPVLTPLRMFFLAHFFAHDQFQERAIDAGLVFDRFRIMEYLPDTMPDSLIENMRNWTHAILELHDNF